MNYLLIREKSLKKKSIYFSIKRPKKPTQILRSKIKTNSLKVLEAFIYWKDEKRQLSIEIQRR